MHQKGFESNNQRKCERERERDTHTHTHKRGYLKDIAILELLLE
jgi:hypothetical protein